ncbi:hypothetical protein AAG906_005635 [Vitis piasezkii]|uniref:Uncharacterized protein n=1 Tax=Vitis vinifera TaxID=29760 RepID=F6HJ28_VITVI
MASYHRIHMLSLFIIPLILQQHVELITASRPLEVYSPAIPGDASRKLEPLSIHEFVINRFKMVETDAYRPTSPGHSPGVGHLAPPGAP